MFTPHGHRKLEQIVEAACPWVPRVIASGDLFDCAGQASSQAVKAIRAIVVDEDLGVLGTLGLVATSDGIDRWIESCYHVLGRADGGPFQDNEPVMQGDLVNAVARLSVDRASGQLDCVAALVDPLIGAVGEVLGVPPVQAPVQPVAGMRVLKSGRETGITEGVIRSVAGKDVVIRVPVGFPNDYELSGIGDSGAVWMTEAGEPVALHRARNPATREAFAFDISAVLAALGLTVI